MDFLTNDWGNLSWSPWLPLSADSAAYRTHISSEPGLYRVRVNQLDALAYIGQTGRDLRERTRSLARQVHRPRDNPPWNDPHTGAPGLWAWRLEDGLEYSVSVAPQKLEKPVRQCVEDMLLYLYRLEFGGSTLANHGRFHPKWSRPTNKSKGRGMLRQSSEANPAAGPSLPPARLHGRPSEPDWLSLPWSTPSPLELAARDSGDLPGVYRLLRGARVIYLGESRKLSSRLRSHRRILKDPEILGSCVAMPGALPHQLKERETDLIGAYFKCEEQPPLLQYASAGG